MSEFDDTNEILEKNIDKTPKSDVIFKILFGDQKHPRLLIHLLNSIIRDPYPITEVEIKQTELTPEFVGQRGVRLDILAKASDGKLINVEIQKYNEHNMIQRSLFHWSKIFAGQAFVSEKYENLKRTICISIMNFRLFADERYWHKDFIADSETNERLTDLLEIHFLELPKVKKIPPESPMLFWLEFINDPYSDKIKDFFALEEVYNEAKLIYEKAIADPKVQELIRVREKAEMDYKDAMARKYDEGRAEERAKADKELAEERARTDKKLAEERAKAGKELAEERARADKKLVEERAKAEAEKYAEKVEMARKLLNAGVDVEIISTSTGLSMEEVNQLK